MLWENIIREVLSERDNPNGIDINHFPKFETPFINNERPDIYYMGKDIILGIECFRFDSSKKTRKGSKLEIENKNTDRAILEEYYKQKQSPFNMEMLVDVNLSYKNYVDSLVKTFSAHASKINEYRENLRKIAPDKKVILSFFIEDVSTLGNYIMTKKGRETLVPFCVKEFVDELTKYQGLDYVLARVQRDYLYTLHIQQVSPQYIEMLYKECCNPNEEFFVEYKPVTSTHIG